MSFTIACENSNRQIADLLLANSKADARYLDKRGRTALRYAARRSYLDIVKTLIDAGAGLDHENHAGETRDDSSLTNAKQSQHTDWDKVATGCRTKKGSHIAVQAFDPVTNIGRDGRI